MVAAKGFAERGLEVTVLMFYSDGTYVDELSGIKSKIEEL